MNLNDKIFFITNDVMNGVDYNYIIDSVTYTVKYNIDPNISQSYYIINDKDDKITRQCFKDIGFYLYKIFTKHGIN